MTKQLIAESALLGTVAGMRSMMPLAALTLASRRRSWLALPAGLASAGELVYDKLPQASDRTLPVNLLARVAAGAIAGGIVAHRLGEAIAVGAGAGALAAAASALLSHRLRAAASARLPRFVAAVGEDAVAVGLSARALRGLRD